MQKTVGKGFMGGNYIIISGFQMDNSETLVSKWHKKAVQKENCGRKVESFVNPVVQASRIF